MQLVEDGCVPPTRFAEYVRGVRRALREARFQGVIFGHAGDGHAHVNALIDVREPDWRARANLLLRDVTNLVASLGGTLAGEHGDGRLRTPLMPHIWSPVALAGFAAAKRAFDPDGILNPGVIIAVEGTPPLEQIKYDPALPPLPPTARAALDRVVREKAWNTPRLSLLQPRKD
jgi:FAD/FMN-containing dehydrogenase